MSNEDKDQSWWQELKPAIYGSVGIALLISSVAAPFTIPLFLQGAEGIVIGSATSLASALAGAWLYWKFRRSE
jgi:hypothetical protein